MKVVILTLAALVGTAASVPQVPPRLQFSPGLQIPSNGVDGQKIPSGHKMVDQTLSGEQPGKEIHLRDGAAIASVARPAEKRQHEPDKPGKIDEVGAEAFTWGDCKAFCKAWPHTWRCGKTVPWPVNCAGQNRNY